MHDRHGKTEPRGGDLAALLAEGQQHVAAGQLDRAAAIVADLKLQHPGHINTWLFAGMVARRQGRVDDAIAAFRSACEAYPALAEPWRQLGNACSEKGDLAQAEHAYIQGLTLKPDDAPLLNNLAVVFRKSGRAGPAAEMLRRATAIRPDHADTWFNLGNAMVELELLTEAAGAYEKALALQPDKINAGLRLAQVYQTQNRIGEAEALFAALLARAPDNVAARRGIRAVRAKAVPQWHFSMMNDAARNEAYRSAIARAADRQHESTGAPATILDIGTGAGMLSMLAARAGFERVYSCEMVPAVAAAANDVIARNRLADRITVIGKRSNDLTVGVDIPASASLVVTETFDSLLLGEDILRTMDHARACLLAPGAQVIPAAGSVIAALVGGSMVAEQVFAQTVLGFDLAEFNRFSTLKTALPLDLYPHRLLSESIEVLRFEFPGDHYVEPARKELTVTVAADGECVGVAQWIKLYLDAESTYENRPGDRGQPSSWPQIVHVFAQPTRLRRGDRLRLSIEHNRASVDIELLEVLPAAG